MLGYPDAGHVQVPQLVGPGEFEVAGPPTGPSVRLRCSSRRPTLPVAIAATIPGAVSRYPGRSSPADSPSFELNALLERGDAAAQLVDLGRLPLPDSRSALAAGNCSRRFRSRRSAISCSTHGSVIELLPRDAEHDVVLTAP